MYELCRVNPENSDELIEEIKRFAVRLKEILPVKEVYLFCSFATSKIHEGSDIDLLIIGQLEERLFDRIGKILDLTELPIEPIIYTEKEFNELKNADNPFLNNIMKTAISIA